MNDLHPLDRKLYEIKQFCSVLEALVDLKLEEIQDEEGFGNEDDFENEEDFDNDSSQQEAFHEFLTHLYNSVGVVNELTYFQTQDLLIEVKDIDVEISKTTIKFYALKYQALKKMLSELIYICDLYYSDYQVANWKETILQVLDDLEYYDDYMAQHL